MNAEEKNKEIDINEVAITLEVDSEVIAKVRSGEITHILMDINEDNQSLVLETIDGNLILVTDERLRVGEQSSGMMPTTFHGCYLYNNGEFPYAIKNSLSFLVLSSADGDCI